MKNSKKFVKYRYISIYIFGVLFQSFTANAGFSNSRGETLRIQRRDTRSYEVYLNKTPIGILNKEKILKSLKEIDYVNLGRKSTFLDIRKAHLDIYGIITNMAMIYLAIQGDHYRAAELVEIVYLLAKQYHIRKYLLYALGETHDTASYLSTSTGLSPFTGMISEWFLRGDNFEKVLSSEDIEISDLQFEKYMNFITENIAKTR